MAKPPPWKRPRPVGQKPHTLTPEQLEAARESARKAGRRYPNLIDNMLVLKKATKGTDED